MMSTKTNVLIALDGMKEERAFNMAGQLAGKVLGFKANDLFDGDTSHEQVVGVLNMYGEVFADVKVHDIPTTAANRVAKYAKNGATYVSVHGSGGVKMLKAAVEAYNENRPEGGKGVLVVTVLTSFDPETCGEIYRRLPSEQVKLFAEYAAEARAYGIVCSALEAPFVKRVYPELVTVVPGTRSEDSDTHDQSRVDRPKNALRHGADILVIGRQVTESRDPLVAIEKLNAELVGPGIG